MARDSGSYCAREGIHERGGFGCWKCEWHDDAVYHAIGQVDAEGCSVHRHPQGRDQASEAGHGMENRPNIRYKDESGMWYGTDKFDMDNKDCKSNFHEATGHMDRKTDELSWYECLVVMSKPRVFKLYNRIISFWHRG